MNPHTDISPTLAAPPKLGKGGSWVEIDLDTLASNIRATRLACRPETQIMFVVKSDAYGHGLVPVAQRAARDGIRWFAVAYLEEALQLRAGVPEAEILVLGVVDPAYTEDLLRGHITPVVVSAQHGREFAAAADALGGCLSVHLKVDTGMGRLGIPWQEAEAIYEQLSTLPGIEVGGLCSHFAAVEPTNPALAASQMDRLQSLPAFSRAGILRHASSSRAFLFNPQWDYEAIRAGIMLYGYGSSDPRMRVQTQPILSWKTQVTQVKSVPAGFPVGYYSAYRTSAPTDIATIAVGYADGYPRHLSNRGHVLIRGRRVPVVGRISMNWITADLGPDSGIERGDEVVLIGQQGEASIWADEIAGQCRTIAYEVLTSIRATARRVYSGR